MNKTRWMIAVLSGAVLPGGLAWASPEGKTLYERHCVACHGVEGSGSLGPPLRNAQLWTSLGPHATAYVSQVIASGLSGSIEALGQQYKGAMPPQNHVPATDLSLIVDYVLRDLNGLAIEARSTEIEQARAAPTSHGALRQMRKVGAR